MREFPREMSTFQQCVFGILKFWNFLEFWCKNVEVIKWGINLSNFTHSGVQIGKIAQKSMRLDILTPSGTWLHLLIFITFSTPHFRSFFAQLTIFIKMSRNGVSGSRKPSINDSQTKQSGPWGHFWSFYSFSGKSATWALRGPPGGSV